MDPPKSGPALIEKRTIIKSTITIDLNALKTSKKWMTSKNTITLMH